MEESEGNEKTEKWGRHGHGINSGLRLCVGHIGEVQPGLLELKTKVN